MHRRKRLPALALALLGLAIGVESLPTLGFGQLSIFGKMAINKQQINITTMADLGCSRPQAPAQAHREERAARKAAAAHGGGLRRDAAGGPSCSQILRESAWLKPDGGNDTRGAWLMASLSRDAYPKFYRLPHSNSTDAAGDDAFKCAWGAKLARLGAQNVTFISGPLVAAAVARAGGNVFVVFRGTSSVDEEENNGLWAGAEAFLWYRTVKVHGGFLATSRHALPTMLEVIQEALDQARTELRQSELAAAPPASAAAPAAGNGTAGEAGDATSAPAAAPTGAASSVEAEPKLYLLGHSRGGGLATVMAAQLSSAHYQEAGRYIAGIYTFGAPKVGNKKFVQSYGKRLGKVTYAWWNEKDIVPFLPPQVWLGYRHLEPESRWRVWNGTCAQAHCSIFDMAAGRACLALDCPTVTAAVCMFNEERDHKQQAYVSSLRKCMPRSAVPDACLAAI